MVIGYSSNKKLICFTPWYSTILLFLPFWLHIVYLLLGPLFIHHSLNVNVPQASVFSPTLNFPWSLICSLNSNSHAHDIYIWVFSAYLSPEQSTHISIYLLNNFTGLFHRLFQFCKSKTNLIILLPFPHSHFPSKFPSSSAFPTTIPFTQTEFWIMSLSLGMSWSVFVI